MQRSANAKVRKAKRKGMSAAARKALSERMKAFWAKLKKMAGKKAG